jgi:membrane protein YdbS with pleckstrin-like domain
VALPRKFLNDDEDLLVELRPHWVFFAGPLIIATLTVAAVVAILVAWSSIPNWGADVFMAVAAVPVLWFAGRLLRWRGYTLALTSTRVLVRRGILDRNIVQLRLQRITEISLSQKLWERVVGTGRLIIDVQGEDDAVVIEFVRKPAIVQRVINGQINELIGGGAAEPIPGELRNIGSRSSRNRPGRDEEYDDYDEHDHDDHRHDTPPFGVPAVAGEDDEAATVLGTAAPAPGTAPTAWATTPAGTAYPIRPPGAGPADIRDRLIELDDLRQRRIISEEEFAAKKAELLSRI